MEPKHNFEETDYSFLESYQAIDDTKDWALVKERMGFGRRRTLYRIWWSAAAVILLLGVGFLVQQTWFGSPGLIVAQAIEVRKEVVLPDGSLVVLNKESELSYPGHFRRKNREVKLSGEAYFEVEGDPDHPFVIAIGDRAAVEVLGTKFNIKSGGVNESIGVQVVEGRVAFSKTDGDFFQIILGKGEQALLEDGTMKKEDSYNPNFLSWKTGILYFEQSPIDEVARQLEDFYGRKVNLDKNLPDNLTFTSIIDNQDFESVLDELSLVLGLDYTYENQEVLLLKPH